jgi:hypothetical protein
MEPQAQVAVMVALVLPQQSQELLLAEQVAVVVLVMEEPLELGLMAVEMALILVLEMPEL